MYPQAIITIYISVVFSTLARLMNSYLKSMQRWKIKQKRLVSENWKRSAILLFPRTFAGRILKLDIFFILQFLSVDLKIKMNILRSYS